VFEHPETTPFCFPTELGTGPTTTVSIYSDEAGNNLIPWPLISDAQGFYEFYTREPIVDLRYRKDLVPDGRQSSVPMILRDSPFAVSVDSFGAIGDGLNDDRAAVQAAVDAAEQVAYGSAGEGCIVWFTPGKTYHIEGTIDVTASLTIDLSGAVIEHKVTVWGKGLFQFRGQDAGSLSPWADDIPAGTQQLQTQSPEFNPGSMIILAVDYDWIDRQYRFGHSHYAQSFLVERIETGGVFHLSEATVQAMSAADGITLRRYSAISPTVLNGTIRSDDSGNGSPIVAYPLKFRYCKNPRVIGTKLEGLTTEFSAYVRFEHCYRPLADGVVMRAVTLRDVPEEEMNKGVYGVQFAGATSNGECRNTEGHGLRDVTDVTYADLVDNDEEEILSWIGGVFWTAVRNCRAYDSTGSGFSSHGAGRYLDYIDCQNFNCSGFSTRTSFTRFINCRAENYVFLPGKRAFDIGGGVQIAKDDGGNPSGDGEFAAFGGQNPLVGCELINCSHAGYKEGLFRICNMSSVTIRDCDVELPQRLEEEEPYDPYYDYFGRFFYSNPRRWQENWRYLPGDWVRDAWQEGPDWHYEIYECREAHTATAQNRPPHPPSTWSQQWMAINGELGQETNEPDHPSPMRGRIVIRNCRFIHQNSGWNLNGLHIDLGMKGPFVFPERVLIESVELCPSWPAAYRSIRMAAFRAKLVDVRVQVPGGESQQYGVEMRLPGSNIGDTSTPPMKIDGVETPSRLEFIDCQVDGTEGPWIIVAGAASYTLIGSHLDNEGKHLILGDLETQGQLRAGNGLALGNAEDVPGGFPGTMKKVIMVYDMDGEELGYLVTYNDN